MQHDRKAKNAGLASHISHILLQLLSHALLFLPLVYIKTGNSFPVSKKLQGITAFAIMALLYFLAVLPLKAFSRSFWYQSRLQPEKTISLRYPKRLAFALKQSLLLLPFDFLLFAFIIAYYYLFEFAPFNALGAVLTGVSDLFGGKLIYGLVFIGFILLLGIVLFTVGRYKYSAMLFLSDEEMSFKNTVRLNKAISSREITKVKLANVFLALPAPLLIGATLFLDIKPLIKGDFKSAFLMINRIFKKMLFSTQAFAAIALILCLVYIPLVFYRKMRLARAFAENQQKYLQR